MFKRIDSESFDAYRNIGAALETEKGRDLLKHLQIGLGSVAVAYGGAGVLAYQMLENQRRGESGTS